MTYNLGLEASKKLEEILEVELPETEKYWAESKTRHRDWHYVLTDDFYEGDYSYFRNKTPSPNLSELSEVFRMLGDKKGWGFKKLSFDEFLPEYAGALINEIGAAEKITFWVDSSAYYYAKLAELWFDAQSQEKCDEFVINLIKN